VPPAFDVLPAPLPFAQAIEAFAGRLPLRPEEYAELVSEARARAFTVGGVASDDLLADVYAGIERALAEGTTFEAFTRDLGERLEKAWGGDDPWRLSTVFQTNVQSAYQAGHYKQMTDPDVLAARPIWRYDAVNDGRTRPSHRALDGMTAPADDPIWDTHFPPNGFNCRCGVITLSPEQVDERGIRILSREETERLARNFRPDKGFEINPGKVFWGDQLAQRAVEAASSGTWEPAVRGTPSRPAAYGRPERIPTSPRPTDLLPTIREAGAARFRQALQAAWGGESATVQDPTGRGVVLSNVLLNHVRPDGRERFLSLLPDVVRNPFEIWLAPMKNAATGQVVMRRRYIKLYEGERRDNPVLLVADMQRGAWVGWTMIETRDMRYVLQQRQGILQWPN
jgi:SPP1 gp7 family putative phage head morphogenesis protein